MNKAKLVGELSEHVRLISNSSIKTFVYEMLQHAPSAFYELPASRSHHMLDEREQHGNLLHTIRVVSLALVIADNSAMPQAHKDILIAGAVLHDVCRYGLFGEVSDHSRPDHPKLVRELAKNNGLTCEYFESIMTAIELHMGRWGDPPFSPEIQPAEALHLADCICARWLEVVP